MQKLKLADDLFKSLKQGDKKITIRRGKRNIETGELLFEGAKDDSLKKIVNVVDVEVFSIGKVPEEICKADGFKNWVDFYFGMKKYYPDIDISEECTVIKFE